MGPLIVIASLVQWVSGIVLAYIVLARASYYGRSGLGPRAFAALGITLFLIGAIELAFVLAGAEPPHRRWLPPDFTAGHWQLVTLLMFSAAAWVANLIGALWNGILGINSRRRIAAAELRRRTDRALHTPAHGESHVGSRERPSADA